jgi:uncharacterized protein (TIGR01319 family)
MEAVLLIDFGSTYTKITAVDIRSKYVIGSSKAFTTIETDICEGLNNAITNLRKKYGEINIKEMYACSSAAGGLKMIAVGLVPDLTAEAAKRAALSAGAKVMKVYSYELNDTEAKEIEQLRPDIILLTGGTDGGNREVIFHNAEVISKLHIKVPIIIAGNKSVQQNVAKILQNKEITICENVMPELGELNIEPARLAIREVFLQKIIYAKGLSKVKDLIEGILMPTPSAVLSAAKLLAQGTENEKGIGDLIVVDVGGATTDIHSIAEGLPSKGGVLLKGLPEPLVKRTVEGDLGVRYSADSLIESCTMKEMVNKSELNEKQIIEYIKLIKENPSFVPDNDIYERCDFSLASLAVKNAVNRHVGTIETHYTPFGATYVQTGKDLTTTRKIIGTGGPIINCNRVTDILEQSLFDETMPTVLKPVRGEFYVDYKYILAAMGLLAVKYEDIALNIMKKEIKQII